MEPFLVFLLIVGAFGSRVPADWRIVGGSAAKDGQFPYQISMRMSGSHGCGGSIINENTILTAAHCVDGWPASSIEVFVGTNLISGQGTGQHKVDSYSKHQGYNSFLITNDIALLHLASNIEYNAKVQPIDLETNHVGANVDLVLSGWGRTSFPGNAATDLQFVHLKSISNEECASKHTTSQIIVGQICTFTQKGEGACHGDSGGPLASNGKQVGIVSWGRPCAVGFPDVFTRVSAYSDWINSNKK